ncbi:hypothetical protein B0H11DRAFT_2187530 [Mycena galericulata]|nr:hypothetical protein B0H11DRAFT_2187530 [Mycena galericulata]
MLAGNTPWAEPTQRSHEFFRYISGEIFQEAPWNQTSLDQIQLRNPSPRYSLRCIAYARPMKVVSHPGHSGMVSERSDLGFNIDLSVRKIVERYYRAYHRRSIVTNTHHPLAGGRLLLTLFYSLPLATLTMATPKSDPELSDTSDEEEQLTPAQKARKTRAYNLAKQQAEEEQLSREIAGGRAAKKVALRNKVWDQSQRTSETSDDLPGRKRPAADPALPPKGPKKAKADPPLGSFLSLVSFDNLPLLAVDNEMDVDPDVREAPAAKKPSKTGKSTNETASKGKERTPVAATSVSKRKFLPTTITSDDDDAGTPAGRVAPIPAFHTAHLSLEVAKSAKNVPMLIPKLSVPLLDAIADPPKAKPKSKSKKTADSDDQDADDDSPSQSEEDDDQSESAASQSSEDEEVGEDLIGESPKFI